MLGKIKCLTFSGGGIRGLSYIGCLKALEEFNILAQTECFVGTSVGAIFALLLNLGYTYSELQEIVITIDLKTLRDITCDGIFNYFKDYGFESGNKLERLMRIFIRKKVDNDNITFKELYNKTGKKIVITGTCLNTRTCEYFNYETYPDMSVISAIRISITVPFVFTAKKFNNSLYVDGGVCENYPLNAYNNKDEILGFILSDSVGNKEINELDEYTLAIIQCISNKFEELFLQLYGNITVAIPTNVGVMEFSINTQTKTDLFDNGYTSTKKYINDNLNRIIDNKEISIEPGKCKISLDIEIDTDISIEDIIENVIDKAIDAPDIIVQPDIETKPLDMFNNFSLLDKVIKKKLKEITSN